MVTTDLGACEWFVWDLRRSNLLDRGQLDQVVGEFLEKNPGAEPPALADYLVRKGVLTKFQSDRLLQGKTQGFVLGPFTLMDALGSGSMGTVYKAQSKNDNEWYAVKVLPRRSMWNVRIARRKVRSFEQCRHPSVVPFVDVGTSGGMHYLAWPLVEGETLDKKVEREGKLPPGVAVLYALQTADGLAVCHKQSLFHGVLKPSNLMIDLGGQIRILDFGIGSLLAETEGESLVDTMSTANSVASGLDCASPESIMDPTNLTPIGDQYSLGCVLYYCLSGRYPFPDGTAAEKMMAQQFKQPTSLRELVPDLPEGLYDAVERLMQKAPEARYANTAEVLEALRPFADSSTDLPSPVQTVAAVPPPVEKPRPPAPMPAAEPRPAAAAMPRNAPTAPTLPTRQSLRASGALATAAAPATANSATAPEPTRPPGRTKPARPESHYDEPALTWEERLGPAGIAVTAVVLCVLAWLLTWKLF